MTPSSGRACRVQGWPALAQPRKIPRYKLPTGVSSKSADLKQPQPTEMPLQTRSRAATLCGSLHLPFSPLTPFSQSSQGWTLDLVQAAQFSLLQRERPTHLPAPTIVPAQALPLVWWKARLIGNSGSGKQAPSRTAIPDCSVRKKPRLPFPFPPLTRQKELSPLGFAVTGPSVSLARASTGVN